MASNVHTMRGNLLIAAVVAGIACGIASTQIFLIGFLNLLFWGAVGVAVGFFAHGKKEIVWSGVLYGFFLSLSFLFSGFQGASDKLPAFIALSLFLSIFGMAGGIICVWIGNKVASRLHENR